MRYEEGSGWTPVQIPSPLTTHPSLLTDLPGDGCFRYSPPITLWMAVRGPPNSYGMVCHHTGPFPCCIPVRTEY